MSIYVTSHVWQHSKQIGNALLLLLALADQANDEGVCWPSVPTLAHKTRLHERTVQRMLPGLLDSGEVELLREGGGRHKTPVYRVVAPLPANHRPQRNGGNLSPFDGTNRERVAPVAGKGGIPAERVTPAAERVANSTERVTHVPPEPVNRTGPSLRTGLNRVARARARDGQIDDKNEADERYEPHAVAERAGGCGECLSLIPGRHRTDCSRAPVAANG